MSVKTPLRIFNCVRSSSTPSARHLGPCFVPRSLLLFVLWLTGCSPVIDAIRSDYYQEALDAIQKNDTRKLTILIDSNSVDVDRIISDKYNCTLLNMAVFDDSLDSVKIIASKSRNLNTKDRNGSTPLIEAIREGKSEIADYLIDKGSNLDVQDSEGITALMWSLERKNHRLARKLVERNAKTELIDLSGHAAMHYAVDSHDLEGLRILLHHSEIDVKNQNGDTSLMLATDYGYEDMVDLLISNGADVNSQNTRGMCPLHSACDGGYAAIVEKLLDSGASTELKDLKGRTPIFYCAVKSSIQSAKLLLAKGANINALEIHRASPLIAAVVQKSSKEFVEFLIARGAKPDLKDEMGKNALDRSRELNIDYGILKP